MYKRQAIACSAFVLILIPSFYRFRILSDLFDIIISGLLQFIYHSVEYTLIPDFRRFSQNLERV